LSRYGIIIDKNIPRTEKFEAVLGKLNEQFGGAAKADLNTWSGQMQAFKNSMGDLQEVLGARFMPAITFWLSQLKFVISEIRTLQGADMTAEGNLLRDLTTRQAELAKAIEAREGGLISRKKYEAGLIFTGSKSELEDTLRATETLRQEYERITKEIQTQEEIMRRTGQSAWGGDITPGIPPSPKPPDIKGATGEAIRYDAEDYTVVINEMTNNVFDAWNEGKTLMQAEWKKRSSKDIEENIEDTKEDFLQLQQEWTNALAPFGDALGDAISNGLKTGDWEFEQMVERWKNLIIDQIVNNAIGMLIGAVSGGLAGSNSGVFSFLGNLLGGGGSSSVQNTNYNINVSGGVNGVTVDRLADIIDKRINTRQSRRMN